MKEILIVPSHKTLLNLDPRLFEFADIIRYEREEYQSFVNTHYDFLNKFFYNLYIKELDIKSARLYLADRILNFLYFLGYNIYHQEYLNMSQFPIYEIKKPVVTYRESIHVIEILDKLLTALLSEQEYEKTKLKISKFLSIDTTSDITGLFAHYNQIVSQVFTLENFKRLKANHDYVIINAKSQPKEYKSKIILLVI